MTARAFAFALATSALACGCATTTTTPKIVTVKPDPLDVHTLPQCFVQCGKCDAPASTITSSPDSAVVAAISEHVLREQCAGELDLCDVRRRACADALERAKKGGAIK